MYDIVRRMNKHKCKCKSRRGADQGLVTECQDYVTGQGLGVSAQDGCVQQTSRTRTLRMAVCYVMAERLIGDARRRTKRISMPCLGKAHVHAPSRSARCC